MKNYTDKELAEYLLETRRNNGREPWGYLKKGNRPRMALSIASVIILFGLGMFVKSWLFCGFIIGLALGVFFRDHAWIDTQRAYWPFYSKVIDWLRVERIAGGESQGRSSSD